MASPSRPKLRPTTVDLETYRIEPRPDYPPKPVGVAIKEPDQPSRYYGFGHVAKPGSPLPRQQWNNSTFKEAKQAIQFAYANPDGVLFHNAKFDLDVIEEHFGIKPPPWTSIHDTMFLLYLDDPNARRIDLKTSAQRLLHWPPAERDALADWLIDHQPVPGVRITNSVSGQYRPGAYISHAPTAIVGPYACGDVDRTAALFDLLHARVLDAEMGPAYDRERRLLPCLLAMERRGVPVDLKLLDADIKRYRFELQRLETWLRARIGADDTLNLDSNGQLIAALIRADLIDRSKIGVTKTGKDKADKATLDTAVTDRTLAATLVYRSQLCTALGTFMEPWARVSARTGGTVYTQWNQTLLSEGGGARTGRLSSSPNFQNLPREYTPIFGANGTLPPPPYPDLPDLPLCRKYIAAPRGYTLVRRDFNGQELRILAHFEDGPMLLRYLEKPDTDFHQLAADMITERTGVQISRYNAKQLGFTLFYGAGAPRVAKTLKVPVDTARTFIDGYFQTFPGIKVLSNDLKKLARRNQPFRTLGGRWHHCEPPAIVEGVYKSFEYKMLNTLIQSSAADQTKDAMLRVHEDDGPGALILSVHDEIVLLVRTTEAKVAMRRLRDAMDVQCLDVPVLSDGKIGRNLAVMADHA